MLRLAASVERGSEHPLARRDRRGREGARHRRSPTSSDFDSPTGKGVIGTVDGKRVVLGNARFLARARHRHRAAGRRGRARCAATARPRSSSPIDGAAAGVIAIADPVKATTPEALKALTAEGIRMVMLTGDNRTTAAGGGAPARHRRGRGRGAARPEERRGRAAASRRAAWSRWPATASTMRRRWPPPMSASPWAPAPTSRSRAPASRC